MRLLLHEKSGSFGTTQTVREVKTRPCTYDYLNAAHDSQEHLSEFNGNVFYQRPDKKISYPSGEVNGGETNANFAEVMAENL